MKDKTKNINIDFIKSMSTIITDGILILDLDGKIVYASNKAVMLLGYQNSNEIIGINIKSIFNDDNVCKRILQSHTEELTLSEQVYVKDKKDFLLKGKINSLLFKDESQNVELILVSFCLDEEQEKYLADFHHMQYLLDYVINYCNVGIAIHDKNMNYIYVSQKYIDQYRVKDDDIIGKNHYDVFPDLPEKWKEVHQRVIKGEVIAKDRDPFPRSDGSVDWTRWECRPWLDINGAIGGVIVYTEVITDQINIENSLNGKIEEINYKNQFIKAMFHTIGDGVITINAIGNIVNTNTAARELLGHKNEEICEHYFNDVVPLYNEKTKTPIDIITSIIKDHSTFESTNYELLQTNTNQYYVKVNSYPLFSSMGEFIGAAIVIKNLTLRKERDSKIEFYTNHDELTGLYNRRYINDYIMQIDKEQFYPLGVLLMDIAGFKIVNDAYGYDKGDEVVKLIADKINKLCNNNITLGRLGGDDFIVVFRNTSVEEIEAFRDNIKKEMESLKMEGINFDISFSFGYEIKHSKAMHINDLYLNAENFLYKNRLVNSSSVRNKAIKAIQKTLTDKYHNELIHSKRVSLFCKKMGVALKLSEDELNELEAAGMYHDIGKISIPDIILGKNGPLTKEEYEVMKTHTLAGYQILKAADEYSALSDCALSHHERWDGTGYPNGIKAKEIPLFARIIAIADAYEAMTADRVYRKKLSTSDAMAELIKHSGEQFDPSLVNVFVYNVLKQN